MTAGRLALGASGEAAAAQWYEARGYRVIDRNWRCADGELDLVLGSPSGGVVFCEVKTRTSAAFGVPAEAVTAAKQRKLRHLAAAWLADAPRRPRSVRFDVACVLAGAVEVIEEAF